MWPHSPGDGCATEYHYWTPAVGRLLQHGSGWSPVGCTTGTGVGAHRNSTGKLNDPDHHVLGLVRSSYSPYNPHCVRPSRAGLSFRRNTSYGSPTHAGSAA